MKARQATEIKLSAEERETLERYVRRRKTGRSLAQHAEIILRTAAGENNCEIARAVGATRQTVRVWRERFAKRRLDGLDDEPRCGGPRKIDDDRIEAVITRTLEEKPAKNSLEHARHGEDDGHIGVFCPPCLAGFLAPAASRRDVQAVGGPTVHRESVGYCRALPRPTGQGGGDLRRRKEPDSGP